MKGVKTGGRQAGTPNKATGAAREAIAAFVDQNTPLLNELLTEIRKEDGPKAAFECIRDLLEYHVPKLARVENTGADNRTVIVVADTYDIPELAALLAAPEIKP